MSDATGAVLADGGRAGQDDDMEAFMARLRAEHEQLIATLGRVLPIEAGLAATLGRDTGEEPR